MAKLGLSSPWVVYYRKVETMFRSDPDVRVIYDEERNELSLFVTNDKKADALMNLMPEEMTFGNVKLKIFVIPTNKDFGKESITSSIEDAFYGNPVLAYTKCVPDIYSDPITYVVFVAEVAQYWTDNICDFHGVASTLYENIAKEVFKHLDNVFYCTDVADYGIYTELEDWP